MADEYEVTAVIREYDGQAQALADQAALHAAGIKAQLTGDVANAANFHFLAGRLNYAPIQLVVPASKRDEALAILEGEGAGLEEGWEEAAEGAIDGWLCRNCDTEVSQSEAVCPQCEAPRADGDGDE